MQRLFFFSLFVFVHTISFAQWSVNTISNSLLANSNVVVRRYATDINIIEDDNVVIAENIVITIIGDNVLSHFRYNGILNDSLINKSIESKVFDLNGKRIKQAKAIFFKNKIKGLSMKLVSPIAFSFPLTIELEYKKALKSINDIRSWKPVFDFNVSVQNANLRLTVSDTSLIRFKSNGILLLKNGVSEDGSFIFLWELNNFSAIKKDSLLELPLNDLPSITLTSKINL